MIGQLSSNLLTLPANRGRRGKDDAVCGNDIVGGGVASEFVNAQDIILLYIAAIVICTVIHDKADCCCLKQVFGETMICCSGNIGEESGGEVSEFVDACEI